MRSLSLKRASIEPGNVPRLSFKHYRCLLYSVSSALVCMVEVSVGASALTIALQRWHLISTTLPSTNRNLANVALHRQHLILSSSNVSPLISCQSPES